MNLWMFIIKVCFNRRNVKIIEKMDGVYKIICNVCGEIMEPCFGDFYDAVQFKKDNRWKSQKVGDGWIEICRDCVEVSSGKKSYYDI